MSSTAIVSAELAVCSTCFDCRMVPDPTKRGIWMDCPECGGHDSDPAGGAALPATPVGEVELWVLSADEGYTFRYPQAFDRLEDAQFQARVWADHCHAKVPYLAGGSVQVSDEAGNEWDRIPIPAPKPVRAVA